MERRDFLKNSAFAGIGLAIMPSLLQSCKKDEIEVNFKGKVLIVGAGAAGMMAAYTLWQYGIDFELIEAGATFGGRVKKTDSFVDFPLDLGAEWLHDQPKTLGKLVNDADAEGTVEMISYAPKSLANWDGERLTHVNLGSHFYREYKFKQSTWYDFFEDFIVPKIGGKMHFNEPVNTIDYSGTEVVITTTNGTVYSGNRVISAVPAAILQQKSISFLPALPSNISNTIDAVDVPPGLKVFIRFKEKFYPDLCMIEGAPGEKSYFDGAFKKETNHNLLTLFYVGSEANELTDLSDQELFTTVMAELDEIFVGKASEHYEAHLIQNWSNEPYILGSYSHAGSGSISPVDNILYFAGEAFTDGASSTVHGAGFSGRDAAKAILQNG